MTSVANNLVQVTITDKNGVQSTRWKRPESSVTKQTKIPTVKPIVAASHWDTLRKDFRPVSKYLLNTTARIVKAKYRREQMISQLNPETLDLLNEKFGKDLEKFSPFIESCIRDESMLSLNNAATLIEASDNPVFHESDSLKLFFQGVTGLRRYEGDKDIDYSSRNDEQKNIGKALLVSAALLGEKYRSKTYDWVIDSPRYIKWPNLEELIRRRPDDHLHISSILNDRNLEVETRQDIEMLEGLLNESMTNALGDGAL